LRQPVRRESAAAARSGAVTWVERFMGGDVLGQGSRKAKTVR